MAESEIETGVSTVERLINNVGVPVTFLIFVCAILVFYYLQNRKDRNASEEKWQTLLLEEQEKHKTEVEKMTEALNNNTIALTKILTLISPTDDGS